MVSISKSTSAKLMDAADRGDLREVKRLVEKKHADVNAKDKDGWTAGMEAAENGHLEVVEYLVENGMDVNARDKDGNTAGMVAAQYGYHEIKEYLDDVASGKIRGNTLSAKEQVEREIKAYFEERRKEA